MNKPKVYFSKKYDEEAVLNIVKKYGPALPGKIAIKLHSGEEGNQNFLRPEFLRPVIEHICGTVVECNTAYGGARNTTEKHLKLLHDHGWFRFFNVDLCDGEGPDLTLSIPNGKVLKEDYIGKHLANYDSMVVLSHFKGHPMGGYGGALKQLSIGCASSAGKSWIHSGGKTLNQYEVWNMLPPQDTFLEAMADAACAVHNYFANKGGIYYVSVMKNMSVDCDCCAVAEDPCMKDIGVLLSTDPIAIDQAAIDIVNKSTDKGKEHFLERVNSRHGVHTIEAAAELGFGSREYELVEID